MGWTKRQLIDKAFSTLALQGFRVNLGPEQIQGALSSLDSMMAEWNGNSLRLGYPIPSNPDDSDIDDDSGIPDSAVRPVYMNLAVVIASDYGKAVTPQTLSIANKGYKILQSRAEVQNVMQQQMPSTLPRGAGNKPWRWNNPFMPRPVEPLLAGSDGKIEFT